MEKSLTISRTADLPYGVIVDLLSADAVAIVSPAANKAATMADDVIVHLEGGWAWFDLDEAVTAEIGVLEVGHAMTRLPLAWKADRHKRLLPSLRGYLSVISMSQRHSEVSFTATYKPPLGLFGGIEDFLLGRKILESVIGRFLDEVISSIEKETDVPAPEPSPSV